MKPGPSLLALCGIAAGVLLGACAGTTADVNPPPTSPNGPSSAIAPLKRPSAPADAGPPPEEKAKAALLRGDGTACLTYLKQAKAGTEMAKLQALCEMAAGDCDAGKSHLEEALAKTLADPDRRAEEVADRAEDLCPAPGLTMSHSTVIALAKEQVAKGLKGKNPQQCAQAGAQLRSGSEAAGALSEYRMRQKYAASLRSAAMCAAAGGLCGQGKALWLLALQLQKQEAEVKGGDELFYGLFPSCDPNKPSAPPDGTKPDGAKKETPPKVEAPPS